MTIHRCKNYEELCITAADWLSRRIRENPLSKIGIATGNSPLGMYRHLAKTQDLNTKSLSLFQLDEWVGLSEHDHSTKHYIEKEVRLPWAIPVENTHYFYSNLRLLNTEAKAEEAAAFMQNKLDKQGPLDLLILGMGKNGHLGFIEPAKNWPSDECYVSTLAESTQQHQMIGTELTPPKLGVTMGLKAIMEAKEILFLVTGTGKSEVYSQWRKKIITPELPASILWQHPEVFCVTDL